MVNKLPDELENPMESILYRHIDDFLPFYKKIGLTPNGLTTISLLLGLAAVLLIWQNHYILGALLWFVSYYYDCADGKMARRYKMTSPFGDLYDHVSDLLKHTVLAVVFGWKLWLAGKHKRVSLSLMMTLAAVFGLLLLVMASQVGCQEKLSPAADRSPTLQLLEHFIFMDDCQQQTRYTRYFSPVTVTLYIIGVVVYIGYINDKL